MVVAESAQTLAVSLPNEAATMALARRLAPALLDGGVVFLRGELGAGKTTVARARRGRAGQEPHLQPAGTVYAGRSRCLSPRSVPHRRRGRTGMAGAGRTGRTGNHRAGRMARARWRRVAGTRSGSCAGTRWRRTARLPDAGFEAWPPLDGGCRRSSEMSAA